MRGVEPKHVLALRNSRAKTPANANNLIRALSSLFIWSMPRGWRGDNPCRIIPKLKIGDGYAPWPWEEIEHFAKHARPDLWHAAALALYSGQRLSDVLKVKWSDINNNQNLGAAGQDRQVPLDTDPPQARWHPRRAAARQHLCADQQPARTPRQGRAETLAASPAPPRRRNHRRACPGRWTASRPPGRTSSTARS